MDRERHARLEELFHRALELPEDQRESFAHDACGDDDEMRTALGALLDEHGTTIGEAPSVSVRASDDVDPEWIGPYRVLERIGEGGFAVVYAAEQIEPVRRRVAVKVLKAGMDGGQVLARFEVERQTLAVMDHPSIARVYDAGRSADGRSYFVMELVEGEPIHLYCARERLDLRARVELMIEVCRAVQHAHQKGVIHRDLKPSNILVSTVDGRALPKVIDFGIAKATGLDGFDAFDGEAFTRQGQFVGTPEYCSPEQAALGEHDVDTRSDVYSLGVVLYELLTGQLPFSRDTLLRAGVAEVLRVLREVDPPRPSTRVSTLGAEAATTMQGFGERGLDARTLSRRLRGELDWIVLKTLEKERARRYESASGLAEDLTRFLVGDPVAAGPPSVSYRAGKFVRRHRVSVAAASAVFLLLIVFAVTMTVQAGRIAAERDRANIEADTAREVASFLTSLFEFSDPGNQRGQEVSARELLDRGAERVETELTDQPVVQASLLVTMGQVYRRIHEPERAARFLEQAVALREAELGARHLHTLYARTSLAIVYDILGRSEEAERLYVACIEEHVRQEGPDHPNTLRMQAALANLYSKSERLEDALAVYHDITAARERVLGPDHRDTHYARFGVGNLLWQLGRTEEAEPIVRQALARLRVVRGEDHPNTLMIMGQHGRILHELGAHDEAVALLEESLAGRQKVHGEDSPEAASTREWLAEARAAAGGAANAPESPDPADEPGDPEPEQ